MPPAGIGTPLKRFTGRETWDAIVVGSGIGGLGAASLLGAKLRKRVLVLERHYTAGGFTHTFRRPGYEWDVGVHYIGQATGTNGLAAMFAEILGDGVTWAPLGDVYDVIVLGDRRYEYLTGRERWRDRMLEYFPAERKAIDGYLAAVRRAMKRSTLYWAEKVVPRAVSAVAGWAMRRPFLGYAGRTTRDVLESLTRNQEMIAVLTGQWGDYGLPPAQSSFGMHAILATHYFDGAFYPAGGASTIAAAAVRRIEQQGGAVLVNADVSSVLVEGGRAAGVRTQDGREFRAPLVISDAGLHTTLALVQAETPGREALECTASRLHGSASHIALYVGLDADDAALALPRANVWVYPGADYEGALARFASDIEAPVPLAFVSFPSAKDPAFTSRFPGRSTIEVVTVGPYEMFERWAREPWRRRGDDYEAVKSRLRERLLDILYSQVPQVRGHVAVVELSTPLTTRHFTNYRRGEMYGIAHDPARFGERSLKPRTAIPGLWLTGQDVCTCGVGGALAGGYLTASAIAGRPLFPRA
jgi:all-trans-retinol 13,14-reductase